MRVYVLQRLSPDGLRVILRRALTEQEDGLGTQGVTVDDEALEFMISAADGDARRGLSLLEAAAAHVGPEGRLTVEILKQIHQKSIALYDKAGEEHYNLISALHKTIRGGDPDASLYWLARMLDGGEEPMYILRRLVRFATEDIGLADPYALTLTLNARDSYHFLGSPEGELAIAQAVVYMACAPKSNSIYTAFSQALADAREKGSLPVPLSLRNAPTELMKTQGYGEGYRYAHDFDDAMTDQDYMPEELGAREYLRPKEVGREQRVADYLKRFKEYRSQLRQSSGEQ